jgi:2-oxoglutarate dehydrogenase E2 component (dihydrolipoamide succinyltransferase)
MATKILVPELGESVLEATVSRWMKKQGEEVSVGEALVELETDKVNLEVGAERSGVLSKIEAPEGEDVKIGDLLGVIEEEAVPSRATEKEEEPPAKTAPVRASAEKQQMPEPGKDERAEASSSISQATDAARDSDSVGTPVAERLARKHGVEISQIKGSGAGGRVTRNDVERFIQAEDEGGKRIEQPQGTEQPKPIRSPQVMPSVPTIPARALDGRPEERVRMSRRRRTIAQRLVEAQQTAAMLTTFNDVNMGPIMDLRQRRNEEFAARFGVKLGITSFFIRASIGALRAYPRFNAEIQGDEMLIKHYYDIGVAIGAEDGLVVPVLRDADRLSFAEMERQIKDYVAKAEAGSLSIEDLRGGTFTITNGGVFGSLMSTPILNPPQVGILGLHRIEDRPVAEEGRVAIRPMMYVAVSYDHRIVDGREAVQFLAHIKRLVEDPERLLLEG